MVAGARTFSLEETFLSPQILNPPPTRHALLAFLLARIGWDVRQVLVVDGGMVT